MPLYLFVQISLNDLFSSLKITSFQLTPRECVLSRLKPLRAAEDRLAFSDLAAM